MSKNIGIGGIIKLDCPFCHKLTKMKVVAVTLPWIGEYIMMCLGCYHRFFAKHGERLKWITYVGVPTDPKRAEYNRKMVENQWFIEAYIEIEQWMEEHPLGDYWLDKKPPEDSEIRGNSALDDYLENGEGIGVSYPERRKEEK